MSATESKKKVQILLTPQSGKPDGAVKATATEAEPTRARRARLLKDIFAFEESDFVLWKIWLVIFL